MIDLNQASVTELLGWQAPDGVLSIYLSTDPGDRGDGWATGLRSGLSAAISNAGLDPAREAAAKETARKAIERFGNSGSRPRRAEIGFLAVGSDQEKWFSLNLDLPATVITCGPAASVRPLLAGPHCISLWDDNKVNQI